MPRFIGMVQLLKYNVINHLGKEWLKTYSETSGYISIRDISYGIYVVQNTGFIYHLINSWIKFTVTCIIALSKHKSDNVTSLVRSNVGPHCKLFYSQK